MSDHRALIEQARAGHYSKFYVGYSERCGFCTESWPCLNVRLADALEAESARASALDQQLHDERLAADRHCLEWDGKLDVAEARAERLVGALEPSHAWMSQVLGVLDGPFPGRIPDADSRRDGYAILEMASAALGLPRPAEHKPGCAVWKTLVECSCGLTAALGLETREEAPRG